jgi:hypothetical protein
MSVQSQLMWLDTLDWISEMNSGAFPFASFDPKKVLDLNSPSAVPFTSISSAPGFDAMATILAEMNNGETASLVNFESLMLFDSSRIFPMKSTLTHRVLSPDPLTERPPHLSVVPATIAINEKPPKSSSSSQRGLFGSPNSSFSSDGGGESSSSSQQGSQFNVHTICECLELRIIHKEAHADDTTPTSSQPSEPVAAQAPSSFRILFRSNDKKTSTLVLPSAPSPALLEPTPASVRLFLRGFLKQEHINPCWIAGEAMVLVPATDSSLEPRTSGPAGSTSPRRKAQMRAKSNLASYAAMLAILSSDDSCAIVDIVAEKYSSNVTALLIPVTSTTGFVIPLHESMHTVVALLSRGDAHASSTSGQGGARRHIPTRSTKSAGVVADQSNSSTNHYLKMSLRSIYPPSFYHPTKSAPFSNQSDSTPSAAAASPRLASLGFLEHGILEPQISTTLLKHYNLLPTQPISQHKPGGGLEHLETALVAALGGGDGSNRMGSPLRKPPGSPRRSTRLNPHIQQDDAEDVFMNDEDLDEETPDPILDTKTLYDDIVTGAKVGVPILSLQAAAASAPLTNLEAELVKTLEYISDDVNHYQVECSVDELRASLKTELIRPVSELLSSGKSTSMVNHMRECRLQIALRLETAASLRSSSDAPGADSSGASSLVSRVELSKADREDVVRLLLSIRILLDADMEGGFMTFMNEILIPGWIYKCPFMLKWLWNRLELERSLIPEELIKAVATQRPQKQPERQNQQQRTLRRKPSAVVDDVDDVDVSSSDKRPKRKRAQQTFSASAAASASLLPVPELPRPDYEDIDIFPASQESSGRAGSPNSKKRKTNQHQEEYTSSQEQPASQQNMMRATRSAALLHQARAGTPTPPPPDTRPKLPTPFGGDNNSSSSSSSSGGTAASVASVSTSTASKNFAFLPFSPADIMNKLTNSSSGIPKPETQVRYLAKRPKSPPKSPPRPQRTAALNSPYKR